MIKLEFDYAIHALQAAASNEQPSRLGSLVQKILSQMPLLSAWQGMQLGHILSRFEKRERPHLELSTQRLEGFVLQQAKAILDAVQDMAIARNVAAYEDVKQACQALDLMTSKEKLAEVLNLPTLLGVQEAFCRLIQERNARIHNTVLSLVQSPHSACNKLLIDVAQVLFPVETYADLLQVLLPEVTHVICLKQKGKVLGCQRLAWNDVVISAFREPVGDAKPLGNLLVVGGSALLAEEFCELRLKDMRQVYHDLGQPQTLELRDQLFSFNADFGRIGQELGQCSVSSQPLSERLKLLIQVFRAHGAGGAGTHEEATPVAASIFLQFKDDWNHFPASVRESTLGEDIQSIIDTITKHFNTPEGCVQMAANRIEALLSRSSDHDLLEARLEKTDNPREHKKQSAQLMLSADHISTLKDFPREYLDDVLSFVSIDEPSVFLLYLMEYPSSWYPAVLDKVPLKLLTENLLSALSADSKRAFLEVFTQKVRSYQDPDWVDNLLGTSSLDEELFIGILQGLQDRPKLLQELLLKKNKSGLAPLYHAVQYENFEVMSTILALFAKNEAMGDLRQALLTQDCCLRTVLFSAVQNKNAGVMQAILQLFTGNELLEDDLRKAFLLGTYDKKTALHVAAEKQNAESMMRILALFASREAREDLKRAILTEDGCFGTVLRYAAENKSSGVMELLFGLYEDADRQKLIEALLVEWNSTRSAIRVAAENSADGGMEAIIKLFTECGDASRLKQALIRVSNRDEPIIFYLASKQTPAILESVLALFDDDMDQTALKEALLSVGSANRTAIFNALCYQSTSSILKLFSLFAGSAEKAQLKEALLAVDQFGFTAFHCAAAYKSAQVMTEILALFTEPAEKTRLKEALLTEHVRGRSVLDTARRNQDPGVALVVANFLQATP